VTDYLIEGNVHDEGKGNWSNIGVRFSTTGVRFVYVSREPAEVGEALEAECAADFSPEILGRLLHIPACCTTFFRSHKTMAERCFLDEYARLTSENSARFGHYDWRMNYLSQYFGYSLHGHYLCRWDCSETARRVERVDRLVQSISPVWHHSFRRSMKGVTILERCGAVHFLRSKPDSLGWVAVTPHRLLSTMPTALSVAMRNAGGIYWRSLFDVEIPGMDSATVEPPLCAIAFCQDNSPASA
jgi:hypothetical protein